VGLTLLPHGMRAALDWLFLEGRGYQFFSGIGFSLFMPFAYYWHHTCHVRGCWRWGHPHPVHGHPVCKIHKEIA